MPLKVHAVKEVHYAAQCDLGFRWEWVNWHLPMMMFSWWDVRSVFSQLGNFWLTHRSICMLTKGKWVAMLGWLHLPFCTTLCIHQWPGCVVLWSISTDIPGFWLLAGFVGCVGKEYDHSSGVLHTELFWEPPSIRWPSLKAAVSFLNFSSPSLQRPLQAYQSFGVLAIASPGAPHTSIIFHDFVHVIVNSCFIKAFIWEWRQYGREEDLESMTPHN